MLVLPKTGGNAWWFTSKPWRQVAYDWSHLPNSNLWVPSIRSCSCNISKINKSYLKSRKIHFTSLKLKTRTKLAYLVGNGWGVERAYPSPWSRLEDLLSMSVISRKESCSGCCKAICIEHINPTDEDLVMKIIKNIILIIFIVPHLEWIFDKLVFTTLDDFSPIRSYSSCQIVDCSTPNLQLQHRMIDLLIFLVPSHTMFINWPTSNLSIQHSIIFILTRLFDDTTTIQTWKKQVFWLFCGGGRVRAAFSGSETER